MVLCLTSDPLPLHLVDGDTYRVGMSRVPLDTVVFEYNAGASAEMIVQNFPTLELPDVHAVIGYYLRHKADVDAYLRQRAREAEELRVKLEAEGFVMSPEKANDIKQRLVERRNHKR